MTQTLLLETLRNNGWEFYHYDDLLDIGYFFKSPRMKQFGLFCYKKIPMNLEEVFTNDCKENLETIELRHYAREVYDKYKYTINYQILKQLHENVDRNELVIKLDIPVDWKYLT